MGSKVIPDKLRDIEKIEVVPPKSRLDGEAELAFLV
jgi:hypothetical protein